MLRPVSWSASATAGVLVAIAVAAAVPNSAALRFSDSAAGRTCTTAQLKVRVSRWFVGLTHTGGHVAFTNRGHATCRLTGWPSLVGVTGAGTAKAAVHVRSTWYGPYAKGVPIVTLRRGQTAEAAFSGSDVPPPGRKTCSPPFRRLRVTPPGSSRAVQLSAWFPPLGRYLPGCARLEVSMVVRPSAFLH